MISNPVPDCARARLVFNVAGRECGTNLWFRALVPPISSATLGTLATRLRTVTGFSYSNVLGSDVQLLRVEVQDYSSGPGLIVTNATPLPHGFGAPALDSAIALKIEHAVDFPIKGHPFVTWLSGIPSSVVDGDFIDPSFATAVGNSWNNYAVNLPIFGWEYVAVQRILARVPLTVGVAQTIRSSSAPSIVVFDRRYRLPGRPR
jgi:hypothetical protein